MPALRSSNLAAAEYDAETQTLEITFKSGAVYTYASVDEGTYDDLLAAASPGKFFAEKIRDVFTYSKG